MFKCVLEMTPYLYQTYLILKEMTHLETFYTFATTVVIPFLPYMGIHNDSPLC